MVTRKKEYIDVAEVAEVVEVVNILPLEFHIWLA